MSACRKLLTFAEENNFKLEQINGCRHFGPRSDKDPIPASGCEVFVGRIPADCYEDELLPFFSTVGQVFEIRLMVTYQGKTRGFAFVKYYAAACAKMAISVLNGQLIRNNRPLIVTKSTDHRTLLLVGVKSRLNKITLEEVEEVFRSVSEELLRVLQQGSVERPVFLLHFASHRAAAVTKRTFCTDNKPTHWGPSAQLIWQQNKEVETRIKNKKDREAVRSNTKLQTSLLLSSHLTFESASSQLPLPRMGNQEWKENVPSLVSTVPMEMEVAGPSTLVNWYPNLEENLPFLPVSAAAAAPSFYQAFGHSATTTKSSLPEYFQYERNTGYFVPLANQISPNSRAIRGSGAMLKPSTNYRL